MADNQCGAHAYMDGLAMELTVDDLLRLVGNRHQTINKQLRDARDELHHGAHSHTEEEDVLHNLHHAIGRRRPCGHVGHESVEVAHVVDMCHCSNDATNNHTEHQWLTQHAKLLLQSLGINIELVKTGNLVEQPANDNGKRRKALTERLRHGDAGQVVVFLEFLSSEVSHHQRDDIAHDGCKIAPQQTLVEDEVYHRANEGKVPVVPKVDVDGACGLGYHHQEVDAQANRNDQRTHCRVVGHGGSSRPSHIKHAEVETEDILYGLQRIFKVVGKQCRNDTQADKAHAHEKTGFQSLSKLHADAQTNDGEDDWHHHRSTHLNDVIEDIHCLKNSNILFSIV